MYTIKTVGEAIDAYLNGRVVDLSELSERELWLATGCIDYIVKNTDRRSARID